jgi:hypothetical protein
MPEIGTSGFAGLRILSCPGDGRGPYAVRAMGKVVVEVMEKLGHSRLALVGHDRGGRVGYPRPRRVSPCNSEPPFRRAVPTTPADRVGARVDGFPTRAAFPK